MRICKDATHPPPTFNASTQTDGYLSPNIDIHIIANVQQNSPLLPLINSKIADLDVTILLDTGSSVSIMSKVLFEKIKHCLKIRYLSRQVKITTVNSSVNFSACVEVPVKISSKCIKHPFYVIDMAEDSVFSAIFGYDFLRKFRVKIDQTYTSCVIDGLPIPFLARDLPEAVHAVDLHNSQSNNDSSNYKVTIAQKTILHPGDKKYIKVNSNIIKPCHGNIVFSQKPSKNSVLLHDAIYNIPESFSKISNPTQFNFYIFAENSSSKTTNLNKGQHIGFISSVEHIKPLSENSNVNNNNQVPVESLNLIKPTDEIIQQRLSEFDLKNFQIDHLSPDEKEKLSTVLKENFAAFSTSLKTLGHSDLVKPEIKFTSNCPIKCLPFPIPQALQAEAKSQIQELIDAGIIEKNLTNWACPMILVKKKSPDNKSKQSYRLALDLRLINTIIEGSSYPLPRIQDLIANLTKFSFFTSLDMPSAYHQIHLPEEYQDQLSFATPWATYKYLRLVFGLKTAAQYFQSMADSIIDEVSEEGLFAYQDDFLIGSIDFDDTCRKLTKILKVFQKHNLTLNPKKCSFHQTNVKYLGFEIAQHKVFPIESNIYKINSFPPPKSKKHVKRFLGLCGYYRHLIPAFAKISAPLVKLTSPKIPFKWDSVHQQAFAQLQAIFFKKPFLIQPNFNDKFYLNTDASSFAISAILMQKQGDDLLPISYFSKTLKESESRYPAIQLELMAIVKGVCAFEYYLRGRHFFILSDSKPLKHYSKISSPANITSRWLLTLGEFDFTFEHLPGKENILADFFSRTPFPDTVNLNNCPELMNSDQVLPVDIENVNATQSSTSCENSPPAHFSIQQKLKTLENLPEDPLLQISEKTILKEQLKDKNLSKFYSDVLNKKKTQDSKFFCIDPTSELLLFIRDPKSTNEDVPPKIAMPNSLRIKALKIAHVPHYGIQKTFQFISEKYYWKGIYADTVNFVQSCGTCVTSKHHRIPQAPFQNNPLPQNPGEFVSMDLVGPFRNGYHILTIIDRFSRHLQLYPLRTISSENVINALFKYISIHGRPAMIHSDLGKQFTAEIFNGFCTKFGIRITYSSPAHPQTNAISERINQAIKATILALEEDGYNFFNAVKIHQMMYNSSVHSTTKFSPNNIHFGREISTLYDTYTHFQPFLMIDSNRSFFQLIQDLEKIYQKVYSNLQLAQKLQNQVQQKYAKLRKFKIGDYVYIKSSHAFKPSFNGPFTIIEKCGPVNVVLQKPNNPSAKIFKIHINRLWISPPRKQHLIPEVSSTGNSACADTPSTSPVIQVNDSADNDVPAIPPVHDACPVQQNDASNICTAQGSNAPDQPTSQQTLSVPKNSLQPPVSSPLNTPELSVTNNRKLRKKFNMSNNNKCSNSFPAQSRYDLRNRNRVV